jgi:tyrosine-protein phosphatase SIW14
MTDNIKQPETAAVEEEQTAKTATTITATTTTTTTTVSAPTKSLTDPNWSLLDSFNVQDNTELFEEALIPPENFNMVCEHVYRSSFPKKKHYKFLEKLKLKSVL